jgi:hypothetical protein
MGGRPVAQRHRLPPTPTDARELVGALQEWTRGLRLAAAGSPLLSVGNRRQAAQAADLIAAMTHDVLRRASDPGIDES